MKITLLLCDHAQEVGGKLYVLGGGWSIYRGTPVTMALAVGQTGLASTKTVVLLTPEETDAATKKTVSYRGPGR